MKKHSKVIAIDLGGTKILAAVVNENGKILQVIKEATHLSHGWPALKRQMISICHELQKAHSSIKSIGIGSAGPLHAGDGVLLDPTNFGWSQKKVFLRRDLEKSLKLPIAFDNDAVASVLGERWLGKASANSICITLGTGLGLGVLINDQIVRGRDGLHAEGGHLVLRPEDQQAHCECGVPGCAEGFLSGVNFAKWVARRSGTKEMSAQELTELALNGDKKIASFFDEYSQLLTQYLCSLIVLYYPREIIFSGSFSEAHPLFLDKTRQRLKMAFARQERVHKIVPKLLVSKLHHNNGLLGAAYMALQLHSSRRKN